MAERDFLLGDDGDLVLRNGTIATGPSLTQEVALLLVLSKGAVRHDPLCGCDLRKLQNSVISRSRFEHLVKLQLERDRKSWADLRPGINIKLNG